MTRSSLGYVSSQTTDLIAQAATTYGVASGGTESDITIGGVNYKLHTFTATGALTVSQAGLFDVLILGGGGGSG